VLHTKIRDNTFAQIFRRPQDKKCVDTNAVGMRFALPEGAHHNASAKPNWNFPAWNHDMPRVKNWSGSLLVLIVALGVAQTAWGQKPELAQSIRRREAASWEAALKIWEWAEPGYQETRSAELLADLLKTAGFQIDEKVANIPTAFTATFGKGTPVIGIVGEFDALPGLSQAAVPFRQPREEGKCGHACGHHLFGVASASAAIALSEQIAQGKISGTIRFYGCPAEEGGSAKVFMVRAGLFADCDAVLHWHPGNRNAAGDVTSLARIAAKFRFHGKAAHAAGAPSQGRSAVDAIELTAHAAELLREHTPDFTRIHHVITAGGEAPNVVPEFAEVFYYVRHPESAVTRQVYRRLELCAQAGALATETKLEVEYLGGTVEMLPNSALSQVLLANLREQNDLEWDASEREFAARIHDTLDDKPSLEILRDVTDQTGQLGRGSTDVADISWVVPTAGFNTICWVPGTTSHSWQACSAGGTTIGKKGMQLAARVLAASAWDLFQSRPALEGAKAELQRRLAGRKYETLMRPGQAPALDYRNPPRPRPAADRKGDGKSDPPSSSGK
jgi:aminobenzoyl-glutamate utilization protein B